ncbi:MAG: portal protein, partial [Candidatus Nanopelagicaceae bacterium]
GLGSGDREKKLAMLQMIMGKQEQILAQFGASNPMVSVAQYRDTLARMIEAAGYKDANAFFNEISPELNAQLSQPQPPSPDAQAEATKIFAEVEREKTQAKAEIEAAKLDLERQALEAEFTRKGMEMSMKAQQQQADMKIREAELAVKQLQAILAMDLADEATRQKQADIVLKAIKELGSLTA